MCIRDSIEGFEKIEKPFNDYFDLAISNIPFGDVAVFDPSYTAMKGMRALVTRRIHNYFFVKALDTVRDGGLVAFITSQGVLNAKDVYKRQVLRSHARIHRKKSTMENLKRLSVR